MQSKVKQTNLCKISILVLIFVILLSIRIVKPQNQENVGEDKSRIIRSRDYAKKEINKNIVSSRQKTSSYTPLKTIYKPSGDPNEQITADGINIGFTLWELVKSTASDDQNVKEEHTKLVRVRVGDKEKEQKEKTQFTPRRINSNTELSNGQWFRISLESPIKGYIYVINREVYKDGTYSCPYLVFPRKVDKDQSDRIVAGKLLYLPNKNDYFEIDPQSINEKKVKVAEAFHVIITSSSIPDLPLLDTNDPREIDETQFEKLKKWEVKLWKFESEEEAGKAITSIEKLASTETQGQLNDNDPLPQTVYHIACKDSDPIFFTITAQIKQK